ncbi:MAG: hypothetical protein AAGA77_08915 [Bacteroidota bacterium]
MTFGERIKEYIDYKRLSVRAFEQKSDLKNGAIYRVINNGTTLNGASITSLGKVWKDLDLNWLMTGEGVMLKDPKTVNEPANSYGKSQIESNEINWCQDALKRADDQIALQRDMIETLKSIIENQKKTARDKGIDL